MARALSDNEVLSLLDALADGQWHSGEVLATQSQVSRAAVAKRVAHLAEWGVTVESQAGQGYRLDAPLERLSDLAIKKQVSTEVLSRLKTLRVVPRVDSTNQRLIEADVGDDPQALFAERQTAGRGRRGRQWISPFGANLYLSLAWSFSSWPRQLGTLSLAVGVACARVLRDRGLQDVVLKWPNDLRIGAAKLGGILIEQRGEAGGACRVVVGVGLNVGMVRSQAASLDQPWISMAEACTRAGLPPPGLNETGGFILDGLLRALAQFESSGFEEFVDDWRRFDATAGRRVTVIGGSRDPVEGIACGIDSDGALIVDTGEARIHLHAGEVSLRLASVPA